MNMKTEADADRTPQVIWLHGDHLSANNPALTRYPDAPVVFVFDEDFLSEAQFAFHRLFFLYESVVEIFKERTAAGRVCSLRRGNVVAEVRAFAQQWKAETIVTTMTPESRFADYRSALEESHKVEVIPVPSLVSYNAARVPRRFSAWWREIESDALQTED